MNMPPASSTLQLLPRFLDALLCASPAVVYATDFDWWQGRLHYLGVNVHSLCGLERQALRDAPHRWLELLASHSRQDVLARLHEARGNGADHLSLNYTIWHTDGTLHHLQDDIVLHRDGRGEVTELVGSLVDVTGRQSLLERFEKLSEQVPGTLYQCRLTPDRQLHFPLVSAGMQRLFGLQPSSIVDNPQTAIERVHPDDTDALWRSIHRSALRMSVWRHEFRYRHPDGHQLWVYGHATPEREADGSILWHGFCEDVTLRKQAQLALAESERRYRFIVENVSDLITLIDVDGLCRFASPSVSNVLGYTAEELHSLALIELLPPDDAPRIQRRIHEASRAGSNLQLELRVRHAQGYYVWVETHCSPYINPASGRYEWLLAVSRDITDRKLREMKLHELSTTDSLTGALNRGAFLGCLKTTLESSDSMPSRLSLVIFDIDHFKTTNDTWGHAAGDLVLASLGEICRSTLRSHDIFGRIGGEEFALVLSGQSLQESAVLAERLRRKFEDVRVEFHGEWLSFTASFGIAERLDSETLDDLMHRADMGLYVAKRQGRNRVHQALFRDS
ncbi:PAS domain S-box-containing protein/diguanylate cyclase (GGDEF) domain-containing protein [Modicisalibacter muralis]|uniref:PAS domain S-box-containing protein/diguanylate cyclase (GGDEF) domain-containing protein n=1 Tax=Modicisalibacter muralis TaxID=119000 RepID=A0A1G9I9K4_9GAMM|nr:sensor domain-containing diguanylate cyclase [Halomonas muralis]SDL21782.1 PAS domain S-box-containing protein/diguanylate cyclase (GGDEF) domain-containing protein [Halomonas muralis]